MESIDDHKGALAPAEPQPQLSPVRVALLLLAIAALLLGGWRLVGGGPLAASAKSEAVPTYVPYVDVTLTPTYPFQLPSANPVSSVYLGFVVADPQQPCTPSWGGYYTLDEAERALDLDARVAQLRVQGGSAMVSFGGRDNAELAVACDDEEELAAAYLAPIERYQAHTIDLDVEGENLADREAGARRAAAIATVQQRLAARERSLWVWLTLPVSNGGLSADGVAAVEEMLAAGVELAGVNAMAMDFGPGQGADSDVVGTIEDALDATRAQVESLWAGAGLELGSGWERVGATVMIGVSDVPGEQLTIADARDVAAFADDVGIPRVSAWSLNRDAECGGAFPRLGVLSNTCSGVAQEPLQFTKIFSRLKGTKRAREGAAPSPAHPADARVDDSRTSPYPIWRSTAAYVAGYKVVWQGDIYQASWWNQGVPPSAAGGDPATDPWLTIGPVPARSRAPKPVSLVSKRQPRWSPAVVYRQGSLVSFRGLPFRARWYTRGDQPIAALPDEPSSPWKPMYTYPGEPREGGIERRGRR